MCFGVMWAIRALEFSRDCIDPLTGCFPALTKYPNIRSFCRLYWISPTRAGAGQLRCRSGTTGHFQGTPSLRSFHKIPVLQRTQMRLVTRRSCLRDFPLTFDFAQKMGQSKFWNLSHTSDRELHNFLLAHEVTSFFAGRGRCWLTAESTSNCAGLTERAPLQLRADFISELALSWRLRVEKSRGGKATTETTFCRHTRLQLAKDSRRTARTLVLWVCLDASWQELRRAQIKSSFEWRTNERAITPEATKTNNASGRFLSNDSRRADVRWFYRFARWRVAMFPLHERFAGGKWGLKGFYRE